MENCAETGIVIGSDRLTKKLGSLVVIRECKHFFTLQEDPVMVRKIKPQRVQMITESCYFYLSPTLCHSVSAVVFRNLISKISKVSGVLVTATRWYTKTKKL